jgi:vacuolar-type H+-ATPase subunit E/Vma4
VNPLLDQLIRDADAEVNRRLDDARARAAAFASDLEARLEQQRAEKLAAVQHEVERETERLRGQARQRANEVTLAARERFVNRVLDTVRTRAAALGGKPAVIEWVTRNLPAALDCFPSGPVVVRASPALVPTVRGLDQREGRPVEIREDGTLLLGTVVESPDGQLAVDATLETLLRAERPRLAIRLVRAAEGELS